MSAMVLDIDAEQYHCDPCAQPSLSSTIAKILVTESPAHAWMAHPRLGAVKRRPTKAMDRGTIIHALLLGKGGERIVKIDAPDYRTKAAQQARDAAYDAGRTPVLAGDYTELQGTADILAGKLRALGIKLSGQSEVCIEWQEAVFMSGATVTCRAQLDHVLLDSGLIFDLKTAESAHPERFARSAYDLGYDIQYAAYTSALRALRPGLAGREDFVFLPCELEPPYCVTPVRLDGTFRALGEARWRRAVTIWHRCMTSGEWPGYANGVIDIAPPAWAMQSVFDEDC